LNDIQPINEQQVSFTNEALRLIMNGGEWIPAVKDGRKVKYRLKLDITMVKRSEAPKVEVAKFTPPKIVKDEEIKSEDDNAVDDKGKNLNGAIVKDIDGNVYHTFVLGTQTWMKENLKTTHYSNGASIANISDNTQWSYLSTEAYCNYDNNP